MRGIVVSASQVVSIVSDVEKNFSYIGSNCTIESAFSAGFVARRCMALHGLKLISPENPGPRKLPTRIQNLPTKDGIDQDYLQILDIFRWF